jgi:predicted AAA+ superfamily ATPase
MIERLLQKNIENRFKKGKVIVVLGPRQVGKTTLINQILKDEDYLFLNGDDVSVRDLLKSINTQELKALVSNHKVVFIDEAQRIENIGLTAKIIADYFKDIQLILSGSSAFDIKNETNEPLTGRKWEYILLPISWQEFENNNNYLTATQQLQHRLVFGMYPDVINNLGDEQEVLSNLSDSYLYKDILALYNIRKPEILGKLLKALAYQIGNEVSYNELAQTVGVDKNTISSYIDILEQSYIVYKLSSFSKNLRNEIKRNQKIYFYDLGIRNNIIGDFRPFSERQDKGAIWENFLITERLKSNLYSKNKVSSFFWRTTAQQEIDYIEEKHQELSAFEFKWNKKQKVKIPKTFTKAYNVKVEVIDSSNFKNFVNS